VPSMRQRRASSCPMAAKGNEELVAQLCGAFKPELQFDCFAVPSSSPSMSLRRFDALQRADAIAEIGDGIGIYHLRAEYYSEEFGLSETPVKLPWRHCMSDPQRTRIEFRTWGRYALFTDPVTRVGGEKCSYHIPTYEALKGVAKSIYWKPTLIWVIDAVRVMRPIRTQTKGTKPLNFWRWQHSCHLHLPRRCGIPGAGALRMEPSPPSNSGRPDRGQACSHPAAHAGTWRAAGHFSRHPRLPGLCRTLCLW
jgi:CRISPR-associated Cas5-like protein